MPTVVRIVAIAAILKTALITASPGRGLPAK